MKLKKNYTEEEIKIAKEMKRQHEKLKEWLRKRCGLSKEQQQKHLEEKFGV